MDAVSVSRITIINACSRQASSIAVGISAGLDAAACETAILGLPEPPRCTIRIRPTTFWRNHGTV